MTEWVELHSPRARILLGEALAAHPPRLDRASLAIAALENPSLDLEPHEAALDGYARRVQACLEGETDPFPRLQALRRVLADEESFRGNEEHYDAPENSFLDHVLTTRVGLPITLSVIYLEVARRAGIALFGVSFPGHFLVACESAGGKLVMDPFNGGEILTPRGCEEILRKVSPQLRFQPKMLVPATVRVIAGRMLNNLKRLYLDGGDRERALKVVDLLLLLSPDHPGDLRIRAGLLSSLGAYRAALADVERCLTLSPHAPDSHNLRLAASALQERVESLN